jgi:hypothetical protein
MLVTSGCAVGVPKNIGDSCAIFQQKRDWYESALESYEKWGVPIHIQMAIIHQESRFLHDAKAPRGRLLWVIPWFRKSSAYGYAQVTDSTWDWYLQETDSWWADRDEFEDVVDFIGWYIDRSHRKLGIPKTDAYHQYLAFHEGYGGYQRKTYRHKKWLLRVARKVQHQANIYQAQLLRCQDSLKKRWSLWPF